MRAIIDSLTIPNGENFDGLKPSTITKIPELAIFTGPNGGGKSRLLRLFSQAPQHISNRTQANTQIENLEKTIAVHKAAGIQNPFPNPMQGMLQHNERELERHQSTLTSFAQFGLHDDILTVPTVISFAPSISQFDDPTQLTFANAITFAVEGGKLHNIGGNFRSSLQTIQSLVTNYLISRARESEFSPPDTKRLAEKFDKLQELTQILLNMKIGWSAGPAVNIGGTPLNLINQYFSQGQKWLLHFAATVYSEIALTDPIVLCLDEPELHLHPSALNQILDILKKTLIQGQIIIATHSIPLIAHAGYENTWFVSEGSIVYAGRNPELVIKGLVGGEEGIARLSGLLDEPAQAATSAFALESLFIPSVVRYAPHDPQGRQILRSLREKARALKRPTCVLDFGAGKGRLIDIAEEILKTDFETVLDLYAFEPDAGSATICRLAMDRAYGSATARVFERASEIPEVMSGKLFDAIVLCNVLHEVSPSHWKELFTSISRIASNDAEILIVEDLQLPHGEHAHGEGFVITSKESLRRLFNISNDESSVVRITSSDRAEYYERLMCVAIPSAFLSRVTTDTVKSALSYIINQSKDKILELRTAKDKTYKDGLKHALYLHQFANATFALDRI